MPPSRGDAAGAPRGDLEIAAAPAPVAPAAARFGSAKSQTGVSTAPSSCTSEEEGPATDPKMKIRVREADAGGEPCFSGQALDSTKTKHAESDSKPVTPETARRREVIARAMAVAAAAAEAKAAAQVLAAKEARAAAARRATARIRGETSPERRDEKKEHAPFISADASRSGALVLGTRVSPSEREKDENVATYTMRVERSSTRRSAKETVRHEENAADAADADADPLADAARKLWGGLWGDARTKESISGGSSGDNGVGSHRSGASHRAATSRFNKGKGATAARRALDAAKKRAHAAQVASARLADASGITGWSCDEDSFLPYESPDGPFLQGTETRVYAPSFLDAPRPAPRDWSRVKARVVSRRNADEEE